MRLLKQYPLLRLVNSYVVDSPQPANLSYAWNFGSLLATCLGLQIVTGVILAMHYTPSVELAFVSVEHIMRDVNYGWLIRYLHANGASFFFILVYCHIGRNLYYGSYKAPRVMPWTVGVIMLVLMMGSVALNYLLWTIFIDGSVDLIKINIEYSLNNIRDNFLISIFLLFLLFLFGEHPRGTPQKKCTLA